METPTGLSHSVASGRWANGARPGGVLHRPGCSGPRLQVAAAARPASQRRRLAAADCEARQKLRRLGGRLAATKSSGKDPDEASRCGGLWQPGEWSATTQGSKRRARLGWACEGWLGRTPGAGRAAGRGNPPPTTRGRVAQKRAQLAHALSQKRHETVPTLLSNLPSTANSARACCPATPASWGHGLRQLAEQQERTAARGSPLSTRSRLEEAMRGEAACAGVDQDGRSVPGSAPGEASCSRPCGPEKSICGPRATMPSGFSVRCVT